MDSILETLSPAARAMVRAAEDRINTVENKYKEYEDGSVVMADEQVAQLNAALRVSPKDGSYRPYCMRCTLGPRVALRSFGFECWNCGNRFGFDLVKLDEPHRYEGGPLPTFTQPAPKSKP